MVRSWPTNQTKDVYFSHSVQATSSSPCAPSQYPALSDHPGSSPAYDDLSPMDEVSTGGGSVPQMSSIESQQPAVPVTL